jgi:hypothetical protein
MDSQSEAINEAYLWWVSAMSLLRRAPGAGILNELERAARENWKLHDDYAIGERKIRLGNIWADRKIVRRFEQAKKKYQ